MARYHLKLKTNRRSWRIFKLCV